MSYPRTEPPEPRLSGEDQRELTRAYAQAEEAAAVAEDMPDEAGGFSFASEVRAVKVTIEELLQTIEATANSHNVRL